MAESQKKKGRPNYFAYHEALVGTLTAIHSLESHFPDHLDFWNGAIFLQYRNALRALTMLGGSLYENLALSTNMVDETEERPL